MFRPATEDFRMMLRRLLLPALLVLCGSRSPAAPLVSLKFFEQHCFECHDADTKKGGLDMSALKPDFGNTDAFAAWVKVHDRMAKGEMPPAKVKKRPPPEEAAQSIAWLDKELTAADTQRRNTEGRAVLRRITRDEYQNTIRDLFALPGLEIKEMLPADGTRRNYDKIGEALDLSHVQLSRYMDAADAALDAAIATRPTPPPLLHKRIYPAMGNNFTKMVCAGNGVLVRTSDDGAFDPQVDPKWPVPGKLLGKDYMDSYGAAVNAGIPRSKSSMALFHPNDNYMQTSYVFSPVYPGKYRLRISLWSFLWNAGSIEPAPKMEVGMLHVGPRTLGYFDAPSLSPLVSEISPWLSAGDEIFFDPASIFKHDFQIRQLTGGGAAYVGPAIATDWMEVEGPLYDQWPPEGHRRLFGDLPIKPFDAAGGTHAPHRQILEQLAGSYAWPQIADLPQGEGAPPLCSVVSSQPLEDAARLLAGFLPRAFRRPVTNEEVQNYAGLVKGRLEAKDCFEDAMRYAYKAALTSANFLFRMEAPGKLSDLALASRLSFWLWDSVPDDELMALARSEKLHEPQVMDAQIDRLLKDPKSDRFVNDFLDQWLRLREIDATDPDSSLYPEFHIYLKESMLEETRAFFRELLTNDLSITNIVASNFLMLNERLAEHYRFIGPKGSKIVRVAIPPDCERGGFITQGSILKITANGTTTSPVIRGVWLNDRILGQPVPPPPPGVPAIDPDTHGATTIREQLEKHRADPVCAACHAKMDPAGFALESFDVIGGLRSRYRSLGAGDPTSRVFPGGWRPVYKMGPGVETGATLADGTSFKDINGLRQHLLADPDQIAYNFSQHLLIYATGTELTYGDRHELQRIVNESAKRGHGIRNLIHVIARSDLFQYK
jgi:uncharacterized protein DUF1592/uncharacterized protein DUF1588/uncharacterized protein DUF1587/uncharacterized protein DUF1585/uncharacterized protein DUF1595/cytochrome c